MSGRASRKCALLELARVTYSGSVRSSARSELRTALVRSLGALCGGELDFQPAGDVLYA